MADKVILNRRDFIIGAGAMAAGCFLPTALATGGFDGKRKLRIGLMLPFSGTYEKLGIAISNGLSLALTQKNQKKLSEMVEIIKVDDRSDQSTAGELALKLVKRDKADILIGSVHTGVALVMGRIAKATNTLMIIPNAGADSATGALCSSSIFRASFSNWQPSFPLGRIIVERGYRKVVFVTWKYGAGEEALNGFKEGFALNGGKVMEELLIPFPKDDFEWAFKRIKELKPDAVVSFFAGAGAAKFIIDYDKTGLKATTPLFGPGFLTEGVLDIAGKSAEGIETTLHYGSGIETKANKEFVSAYVAAFKQDPDVYAVHGYDSGLLLRMALSKARYDPDQVELMRSGMENAVINSPRGVWTMSKARNPIQDIYLRRVESGVNKVKGIAHKALADPASGCKFTG